VRPVSVNEPESVLGGPAVCPCYDSKIMPELHRAAIVLAAGASSRMGSPKALLAWQGTTLLGHAIRALRAASVEHLVVILGVHHEAIEARVPELADAHVRLNLDEATGRSHSIRIGAAALANDVAAVVVQSVDQPCDAELLSRLFEARGDVVVPCRGGRRGHPVCFAGWLLPELRAVSEAEEGLRAVVRRHTVVEVPVADETVFWNLNDPQAYAAAVRSH
jgi:molybdenum cofactor cytidylyltransferase